MKLGLFQLAINKNIGDLHLIRALNDWPLGVIPLLLSCHRNVEPFIANRTLPPPEPKVFTPAIKMLLNIDAAGSPEIHPRPGLF